MGLCGRGGLQRGSHGVVISWGVREFSIFSGKEQGSKAFGFKARVEPTARQDEHSPKADPSDGC